MVSKKQKRINWILVAVLLVLSIFFLFPVIWMLANSFKPDAAITADMNSIAAFIPPALDGSFFDNYIEIITNTSFLRYMGNTLLYAAILIVLGIIVNGLAGYALAKICSLRGADVTLVTGKTSIAPPRFVKTVEITTAHEMYEAVTKAFPDQDIVIKAAAVADYRPASVSSEKIKKTEDTAEIRLERTEDILASLGSKKRPGQFLCGFSMETENMLGNSRAKLAKKNLDMIVANNLKVPGAGFAGDTNVVTLITEKEATGLPLMSKEETAVRILDKILEIISKKQH